MLRKTFLVLKQAPWEAIIWFVGLVSLACYEPRENHFTICPLYNLGFHFCPGCGLGRSVSYLLHGDFSESFSAHPLGIFALIVLSYRIIQLIKPYFNSHGKSY